MTSAAAALERKDYNTAEKDLQNARVAFNQMSNFYQQLFNLFLGIDSRVADRQRIQAVEAAQLRDEAAYRLALVHLAKNEPELTVPLLIQVVRSQNPVSSLGQQAHQQLFDLGFIDNPVPLRSTGSAADLTAPTPGTTIPSPDTRPLAQPSNVLNLQAGKKLMEEASTALSGRNYAVTVQKLQEARQIFNQLSNFYQDLSSAFRGIYTDISETQRQRAIEAALLRDEAAYQLALVHRVQNQAELAVPLLIQILQSQDPSSTMGQQAYQQLFELGFVDAPYQWNGLTGVR